MISLVIPAKNEEEGIGPLIRSARNYAAEVILVDGHSVDRTRDEGAKAGAKVIMDKGKGKGDAIKEGIQRATGEIIVFMDGDGSHRPEDIPELVRPIIQGRADLVIGSRILGGSDEFKMSFDSFLRQTGSNFIALIINWRWGTSLTDIQNGFRAIKADAARSLKLCADDFDIEEEMVMKCLKKGYRVAEVASHEEVRRWGKSKLPTIRGYKFIYRLFKEIVT